MLFTRNKKLRRTRLGHSPYMCRIVCFIVLILSNYLLAEYRDAMFDRPSVSCGWPLWMLQNSPLYQLVKERKRIHGMYVLMRHNHIYRTVWPNGFGQDMLELELFELNSDYLSWGWLHQVQVCLNKSHVGGHICCVRAFNVYSWLMS